MFQVNEVCGMKEHMWGACGLLLMGSSASYHLPNPCTSWAPQASSQPSGPASSGWMQVKGGVGQAFSPSGTPGWQHCGMSGWPTEAMS